MDSKQKKYDFDERHPIAGAAPKRSITQLVSDHPKTAVAFLLVAEVAWYFLSEALVDFAVGDDPK